MFDPLKDITSSPERTAAVRRALVGYADAHPYRRRRRARVALIVLPIVFGAGLTAGTVGLLLPVTDTDQVACLARAELHGDGTFPGTSVSVAAENGEGIAIEDAVAACQNVWSQGLLDPAAADGLARQSDGRPVVDPSGSHPVPQGLTVCVREDGSALVTPGGEHSCSRLGLPGRRE